MTEREKFILANAFYAMRKYSGKWTINSNSFTNLYDAFQAIHSSGKNNMLHHTSFFPPQHQFLVWLFESGLRYVCQKSTIMINLGITAAECCKLTLAFWRWNKGFIEVAGMQGGGYWDMSLTDIFADPNQYFGDMTPQNQTGYIDTGLFNYTGGFDPITSPITRWHRLTSMSTGTNRFRGWVVDFPTYEGFLQYIHGSWHGQVHGYVGSTMQQAFSAAKEPLFWLHHNNVERCYQLWRNCHNLHLISPNAMTANGLCYKEVNPIGGLEKDLKRDTDGTIWNLGLDVPMNYYMDSSSRIPIFLPQNEWPTVRQCWDIGSNPTDPVIRKGFAGMWYRYVGTDEIAVALNNQCPCGANGWKLVGQPMPT
jgi:hypothetical protein